MTQASKPTEGRTVWHIFEFNERFELAKDKSKPSRPTGKKGGLMYIQVPVGANDAAAHLEDIEFEENSCELFGAYVKLARQAAKRSRAFRGYLLTGQYKSASVVHISRWLNKTPEDTTKILEKLRQVGLLDRVPLPEGWNTGTPEDTQEDGEAGQDDQEKPDATPVPQNCEKLRNAAKPLGLDQDKPIQSETNTEPKEIDTEPSDGNESESQAEQSQGTASTRAKTVPVPTPTCSDAAGAQGADCLPTEVNDRGTRPDAPGASANPPPALPPPGQGKYNPRLVAKHGTDALDTANDLLRLLGYKGKDMNRQWGNLAAWWNEVKAVSWPGGVLAEIKAQAFTKADLVGRNIKVPMKSRPKYLRKCLDNLASDWKRKKRIG